MLATRHVAVHGIIHAQQKYASSRRHRIIQSRARAQDQLIGHRKHTWHTQSELGNKSFVHRQAEVCKIVFYYCIGDGFTNNVSTLSHTLEQGVHTKSQKQQPTHNGHYTFIYV